MFETNLNADIAYIDTSVVGESGERKPNTI